ncbi:thioesterase [Pedobacter lusitanus]|uniref:Thioesterase n=1 Tax=Pedobacter lusitanus TaxID=1503925 RepID=A0A0D0GP28_9SPHI|nr:thioesterase family protein [Pedobacter lusitanus]KIO77880.1 thioesterase [Pedobacter lusitanus]
MVHFQKRLALRWADLDPNFHLRHSSFYDLAAQARLEILGELGLTMTVMQEQHFGPVIFKESCTFIREIKSEDIIYINIKVEKMSADGSKWSILQEFTDDKDKVRAILTVEGSWIDTKLRKLARPVPQVAQDAFNLLPKIEKTLNDSF